MGASCNIMISIKVIIINFSNFYYTFSICSISITTLLTFNINFIILIYFYYWANYENIHGGVSSNVHWI